MLFFWHDHLDKDHTMTAAEIEIALAFDRVKFLPASWDKSFARQWSNQARGNPKFQLTDKQAEWLYRLLYKYRRQIPDVYEKYQNHPCCCKSVKSY